MGYKTTRKLKTQKLKLTSFKWEKAYFGKPINLNNQFLKRGPRTPQPLRLNKEDGKCLAPLCWRAHKGDIESA